MEKENIASECSENRCELEEEAYSKNKRSSILKIPRNEDVNFVRSSRRVSFSSNFIKPFTTDDEKNTIWDNTIEESINNTESVHSSEHSSSSKENGLNTSLFFDEINEPEEGSFDMELTECTTTNIIAMQSTLKKKVYIALSEELLIDKENIPLSVKKTLSLTEKENIPLTIKESICLTEKENIIIRKDVYQANIEPVLMNKPLNECIGPKDDSCIFRKPAEFTTTSRNVKITEDSYVDEMELTCQTAEKSPSNAVDMEFTCQHPVLLQPNPITQMSSGSPAGEQNSDMDFTCQNPVISQSNTITQMSSGNPALEKSYASDMEFTCQNPVLIQSNAITRMSRGNPALEKSYALDMEFTCQNPVLPQSIKITQMSSGSPALEQSNAPDMEFTCQNPVLLESSTITQMSCGNPALEQSNARDMEFTCQNPVLIQSNTITQMSCGNPPLEQSNAPDMEFTCQNPVLSQSIKITQMSSGSPALEQSNAPDMEFTCQNPVLIQSNTITRMSRGNPALEKSYASDMEFTCQNPVLSQSIKITQMSSRSPALEQSNAPDMEFTCQNPVLLESNTITQMSCGSPALEQSNARDMEFTCQNPVLLQSNTITQMSCGSPALEQSNARDMESTCQNPVLSQSNDATCFEDDSRGFIEQNVLLSFRNNVDVSNVKEYSTCVDGTMQLIHSADNVVNPRNSTCDEFSLGNVSKHQINLTYHVKDAEETEQPDGALAETDENQETAEEKEPVDEFSKINMEDTALLEQESISVLANHSNDCSPFKGENFNTKLYVEDNSAEKKTLGEIEITEETTWNATEFLARKKENMMKFVEKWNAMKLTQPPVDDRIDYYRNRFEETKIKYVEYDRIIREKYPLFERYRDRILKECQDIELPPESYDNESVENADESDCLEKIVVPTIIQAIEEKAQMCDGCWKIVKLDHCVGHFTTLFGKLEFSVEYDDHSIINNLSTKSLLTDKAKPIAHFLQKELLRTLTNETISNSIGRHYNILTLLDYIQMVMEKIKRYYEEIKDLEKWHQFTLTYDFQATLVILDVDVLIKWIFNMDLSDLENITKNSITVRAVIGTVNEKYLLDLIDECPKGIEFIQNYFCKIQDYLKLLKKKKDSVKNKKVQ